MPTLSLCIKLSHYCRKSFLLWECAKNEQLTEHKLLSGRTSNSCAICTEDGTDGQARVQTVLTLFSSSEAFAQKYPCQRNLIQHMLRIRYPVLGSEECSSHSKCVSAKLKNFQIPSKQNSELVWWSDPGWIPGPHQRHFCFSAFQKKEL